MRDLKLTGPLDEHTELPTYTKPINGSLSIDLKDLSTINSVGCRTWINWIKSINASDGIYLYNCPPQFISQVSILFGFVPEGVIIQSFYVPYYCDSCGAEEFYKVEAGNSDYEKLKVPDNIICPVCSASMHIDVVKEKFLAFWKKKSA